MSLPGIHRPPTSFLRLTREFVLIASGQGLVAIGGVVGVRLLTHALSPPIYGELALGMTLALLAQQTVLAPLAVAFLRFFSPAREARAIRAYAMAVRRLLVRATFATLVLAGACVVGLVQFGHAAWVGVAIAASILALLSGYNAVVDSIQNAA